MGLQVGLPLLGDAELWGTDMPCIVNVVHVLSNAILITSRSATVLRSYGGVFLCDWRVFWSVYTPSLNTIYEDFACNRTFD